MESMGLLTGRLLEDYGYFGLGLGLILNCMGVPIPSEALLPLAGVAVSQNLLALPLTLAVAVVAQMAGLMMTYGTVRLVRGKRRLARSKRKPARGLWLHRLDEPIIHLERMFEHGGPKLILVCLCMPGLRGFAGYAAGLARIPVAEFAVLALVGSVAWGVGLVLLGYYAAGNIEAILKFGHTFGALLAAVVAGGWLLWYSRHRRRIST